MTSTSSCFRLRSSAHTPSDILCRYATEKNKRKRSFLTKRIRQAMKEVLAPVTMTSVVNASMFAILNLISIPAVYLSARAALIAVVFLYLTVIFCYPAYCYLDMGRQLKGRYDVCYCKRRGETQNLTSTEMHEHADHGLNVLVYEKIYKPLMLSKKKRMRLAHVVIWAIAIALFVLGIWGITDREIGLGLEVSQISCLQC